jgi:uncharacterized membrane protein YphA (DoxX/SURF4 family)
MQLFITVLQLLLGIAFLMVGGIKLTGDQKMKEGFARSGYPYWFLIVTGLVEVIGAVAMLVGLFYPVLTLFAVIWLGATMVGALYTHFIRAKDNRWQPAAIMLALLLVVGYLQPQGLPTVVSIITSILLLL